MFPEISYTPTQRKRRYYSLNYVYVYLPHWEYRSELNLVHKMEGCPLVVHLSTASRHQAAVGGEAPSSRPLAA